ncbi:MAG: sensor domain-containing diguanylate cyclase [Thermoanaerobaculia bacterium]
MVECHSMRPAELERFLERQKATFSLRSEFDLDVVLMQILQKAYEFVPSESGSILLDDPVRKRANRKDNDLVFISTFGDGSEQLIGQRLSARDGIAGKVYQTGVPYLSPDVATDENFFGKIDEQTGFKTHSIVCVPIYIGKTVCGVLELINRSDGRVFTSRDLTLLEIFAGYTSFTLQNSLDAKRAHELAKRDDLTGLFNDRWFHVCLTETLVEADSTGEPATLLFMDLDNFKKINDLHGHLAGSQVLREAGFLLKRVIDLDRATVARYGGDEFVAVLPRADLATGIRVAEEIREAVIHTTFLEREYGFGMPALNLSGVLSISIGVAVYQPGVESGDGSIDSKKNEILRRADAAMYEAKSLGKGRIVMSRADLPATSGGDAVLGERSRLIEPSSTNET